MLVQLIKEDPIEIGRYLNTSSGIVWVIKKVPMCGEGIWITTHHVSTPDKSNSVACSFENYPEAIKFIRDNN